MSKTYIITLAFAPARTIISCFNQVYSTMGFKPDRHLVLNQHYPINKELNTKLLETLCQHYNAEVLSVGKNIGLSAGLNYMISQLNIQDDDIIIGLDNDVWAITQDWLPAIQKVLQDPKVGWVSLMNPHSERELIERGYSIHTINGVVAFEAHQACLNSICGFKGKMLKELGALKESGQYYGGLESVSFPRVKALGYKWVYLPEFREEWNQLIESDGPLKHYKFEYAHKKSTTLDYESWLNENPERLKLK